MLLDIAALKLNEDDPAKSLKLVQNWLVKLIDNINDCLCSLDESNMADGFVETLTATKVIAQTVISNTVITNNLYSEFGDVAELACDMVLTANKVDRYKNSDASELNYILISGRSIEFLSGNTEETPTTVQHKNRKGENLYWKTAEHYEMSTDVNADPVTVYKYTEHLKAKFSFEMDDSSGYYVPTLELGTGTVGPDSNIGKGYIYKGATGLYFDYYSATDGSLRRIELSDNGIAMTPNNIQSMDIYSNGFRAVYAGQPVAYTWMLNTDGTIKTLITDDNVSIPVNWHAGAM